ncbi:hypothetical protein AVEN_179271-1 [Araneus ventricosus]|uniref:Uncharacterized protein n=1 Tax=Araneus ventricosus TaxID=182803 RepID=A0A4Y2PL27_ARAVE|nr:hypothetical protein AVEN_179271-1 [Araneus ventricosus]
MRSDFYSCSLKDKVDSRPSRDTRRKDTRQVDLPDRLIPVRMSTENRMKKSVKQESIKIVHRRLRPVRMRVQIMDSLEMRLDRPTDSQPFEGFAPKFYTDLHS